MSQTLYLGIDTGGTFTDAVLMDSSHRVQAAAKRLTTRHDLAVGIADALAQFPAEALGRIGLVSLSTTLTTNSVVEGKGSPVCALLIGYDARQIEASGLAELIGRENIVSIAGGHDAQGGELLPLDEDALGAAICSFSSRVSAFAVSASFGVRNPAHEIRARSLVEELSGHPVTCGHELASSLGAPRRATTAALNARMIAHVGALIGAVRRLMAERKISAPLMIVRGDGSLVNAESALKCPVSTVLSGPAASVIGACALSGLQDAIVADMGGTTTDIAVVRGGQPALGFDGALIGDWRPMVEAIRVYSVGLGGDSEVRFGGGEGVTVGPRRVVPLSLLAHRFPQVRAILESQARGTAHPAQLRFALPLDHDQARLARLDDDEARAWEVLARGPVDIEGANIDDRRLSRAIARLERKGLAIYSGFTPTDAAHVLGISGHWDAEAAHLAARIWSRQMRSLYGCGTWEDGDAHGPSRAVFDHVVEAISLKLVEAGLHDHGMLAEAQAGKLSRLLARMVLDGRRDTGRAPVFRMQFDTALPVVAVGGPAQGFYPAVAEALGVPLILPEHAQVANAVGAVMGRVAQRVHLTVLQPARGVFRVFARSGPRDCASLPEAFALAREVAAHEAEVAALAAGAASIAVRFEIDENSASGDGDEHLFFEARVTAIAEGPPVCARTGVAFA